MSKKPPTFAGRSLAGITVQRGEAFPAGKTPAPTKPPAQAAPSVSASDAEIPQQANSVAVHIQEFSLGVCVPGAIVRVPLHMIDANPLSPRRNYTEDVVDKIAVSLPKGQFDAAHGYLEGGRVKLIDGGTRFKAARDSDTSFLDVKFELPPASKLDLFNRARDYNENRSDTTPLDFALSLRALLEQGAVASQKELTTSVKGPNGKDPLTEVAASKYLRIARLPTNIQRLMSGSEHTSNFYALFEVSALFPNDLNPDQLEERTVMASEIVEEIKLRSLNVRQIQALVNAKLEGPKSRERSTTVPLTIGNYKGAIKTFAKKGRFELQVNGLEPDKLNALQTEMEATIRRFLTQ